MVKLSEVLIDALEVKERTLKELYLIVEDHPEFDWIPSVRKHRIRSAIYNLKKFDRIKQTAPSTYKMA